MAFESDASNLVGGDTNNARDVFLHDRQSGKTVRVSVASNGAQANGDSYDPWISADGVFVAFDSYATNLVVGDTNAVSDVFLRDRLSGQTMRISVSSGGVQGNQDSYSPSLSADGRLAASSSGATNLVAGDTNAAPDVFIHENAMFRPAGPADGWVLESSETSGAGGTFNTAGAALNVGDDAADRQYRAILSFNTAGLPDNAVLKHVSLRIKTAGMVGTNPFTTHGSLLVDVRKGAFSNNAALEPLDFQSPASKNAAMTMGGLPAAGWYRGVLPASNFGYINLAGVTQFRLRFQLDDNDDAGADFIQFYSGNAANLLLRPELIVEYTLP